MRNTAVAAIDLGAVRHNLNVIRTRCHHSRVMVMIKANAYGHGLREVAQILSAADGFAVARLQEALLLREYGIRQRLLLLATLLDRAELAMCSEQNIDVVAHDQASLDCILAQAHLTPLRVWLKLDSGMHRAGFDTAAFIKADRLLCDHPGILNLVHMTHFASADNAASRNQQLARFSRCREQTSRASASLANSAALIASTDTHGDWVRPGLMVYGVTPTGVENVSGLRPAMTLQSFVIAIRHLDVGEPVGYDGCWTARRPSRIGTIGIGYGDGYPRHARNGTPVWINGQSVALVGRVSMDSLMVDLTDCPSARVGDQVEMWGPHLPATTVAQYADSIAYELFTSVQERVTRVYLRE
jgi:alanine racemase